MKALRSIFFLMLVSVTAWSQPCDYEIDQTDEYMGTRKRSTKPQTVWSDEHEAMMFVLSNDDGRKALELIHRKRHSHLMCLDEGSRIEIVLENGNKITLENTSGEECADESYSDIHQTVEYILGCGFQIHPDEEALLLQSPVEAFRLYFDEGHDDFPLPEVVVMHEKGFDLYGEPDFPAHLFFIRTLPCIQ